MLHTIDGGTVPLRKAKYPVMHGQMHGLLSLLG